MPRHPRWDDSEGVPLKRVRRPAQGPVSSETHGQISVHKVALAEIRSYAERFGMSPAEYVVMNHELAKEEVEKLWGGIEGVARQNGACTREDWVAVFRERAAEEASKVEGLGVEDDY